MEMSLLQNIQPITWQELEITEINNSLLFLLLLVSCFIFWKKLGKSNLNLPPSPPKLPVLGNLHQLGKLHHRSLRALSLKYGPLMFLNIGQKPTLVVSSAKAAREVLTTHDIEFADRPKTTAAEIFFYSCSGVVFSSYGEYWKKVKKLCVTELLSAQRVRSYQSIREEQVDILIGKVRCACLSGASIDMSEMLLGVINSIISLCVMGRKATGGKDNSEFGELLKRLMLQLGNFSFADSFPIIAFLDNLTGITAHLKATSREIDAYLDQVIEDHSMEDYDEQLYFKDFVHIFLELQRNGKLGIELTRDNIKAILLEMFVGGTVTTATTIEWAMAELVRDQKTMRKAQQEVRRVVGNKSNVEVEDIEKMAYLKWVVKETLRLHPALPLLIPRETSAGVELGGYSVPARTVVLVNAFAIHLDPEVWESPEKFIPERYEKDPVDFKDRDYKFLAFGGGRRVCPGLDFGQASTETVLANLLYWFDWTLPDGRRPEELDMDESFGLSVSKKTHLRLIPTLSSP
ncbi:hypothetical protein K2173_001021 [Erythroxylum novogranatense]|uniref:Cytochrome P450 n=1 Tax=Erythroxylum novogranatense TaxID=1862640 RepID=A0AAV8SJB2_9ROSI|nr:hypothetical protein K2173_001021 [Erythroxylum novogranatense]